MLLAWQKCFLELDPDAMYMFEVRFHLPAISAQLVSSMMLVLISAYMSGRLLDLVLELLLCSACLDVCDSIAQRDVLR